jgi:starch synthase (maltosyl-transferring)
VFIQGVKPEIDAGRYPVKRIVGDRMIVECDIVSDGHDIVRGALHYRARGAPTFEEVPLESLGNDRFRPRSSCQRRGSGSITFSGWIDAFATWRRGFQRKGGGRQDVAVDLLIGVELIEARPRAGCRRRRAGPRGYREGPSERGHAVTCGRRRRSARRWRVDGAGGDRTFATHYPRVLEIVVTGEGAVLGLV